MKKGIHPNYHDLSVRCSCGNELQTRSTLDKGQMTVEVCSKCHPFFTGQQKIIDAGGRVDRFRRRFGGKAPEEGQPATG